MIFIQISIIHDHSISSQVSSQEKVGSWPMDVLNHHLWQLFVKFIHQKCHPRSYHSDIKYLMKLNIIFIAGMGYTKLPWSTAIGLMSVILFESHFPISHLQAPSYSPNSSIYPSLNSHFDFWNDSKAHPWKERKREGIMVSMSGEIFGYNRSKS